MFSPRFPPVLGLWFLPAAAILGSPKMAEGGPYDNHLVTVEHISLPNFGRVTAIVRDDRGFLWFGTSKGLYKYDGYEVKDFKNVPSGGGLITAILKREDGSLLIAAWGGLWIFNVETEQFTSFLVNIEFPDRRIEALAQDARGRIWIGTRSEGLFEYDRATQALKRRTTQDGLSDNRISSLLVDQSGVLWIGTRGGGLNSLDPATDQIVHYRYNPVKAGTLSSDVINALHEHNNKLLIGTGGGLALLDRETGKMRGLDLSFSEQIPVHAIVHDLSGVVWIGTRHGIFTYFNGALSRFAPSLRNTISLSDAFSTALYLDPTSSSHSRLVLWIGTRGGGINKVQMTRSPFTNSIRNKDSFVLDQGSVLSIYQDRQGFTWVGLWGGGLEAIKNHRRIAHYKHEPGNPFALPNDAVGSLLEDREGVLWVGTFDGLAALDPSRKRFTTYKHIKGDSTSLSGNEITELHEDRMGRVWIGTDSGLSQVIRGVKTRFKNYLHFQTDGHPFGGNRITDITEDKSGNLWVSMFGGGLLRFDNQGQFIRFLHPSDTAGRQENWVTDFHEARGGVFWLTTQVGLVTFDPRTGIFTRYNSEELRGAHVTAIESDQAGNLWLSTAIGLIRLNPKTGNFYRYGDAQGLPFKELTSGFFRNGDGKLFVGGLDGFTEFIPESAYTSSAPPTIAITGFSIFDKTMPATVFTPTEISLNYDQNFFSFSFAALDYSDPKRNRYNYRMLGVDADWINAGHRNYASYTNLDPGEYVFQVKGSNSDDVWNEAGTSIRVTISPPYWQTWWFRILLAVLIASAMYAAYRYRLKKFLEVERLRLRIADDLHDDVGSNLSTIAMVSRAVQRAPELGERTRQRLEEIYDTAVVTAEVMKDIVWFIKPENDTLDDLLLRMKDAASSLLINVNHDFQSPKDRSSTRITVEFKRNFFLAFKEILTNIVKHASATAVNIQVEHQDGKLEMVIHDNGQGFDERTARRGSGLASLQTRALGSDGACEITSEPGKGTTVRFSGRLR